MSAITIKKVKYYDIDEFKTNNMINSDKTVYNWVSSGKAEQIKKFNKSLINKRFKIKT